jgi:hypothetical protein
LPDSDEWTAALFEQRIALMTDEEFAVLVTRTRAPQPEAALTERTATNV